MQFRVNFFYLVVIAQGGRNSYYNQVKIQLVNRDGFSNLVVEAIAEFMGQNHKFTRKNKG